MRIIIAMAILMLAAACSTNSLSTKMASWQGSHIDEISSAWGSPDECIQRDGRQFCTWTRAAADQSRGSGADTRNARPICVRTVEVDESGSIIGWRWRGDRCADTATEVLARTDPERPEVIAAGDEQSTARELVVIEPAAQPAITRTQ